ncbi:hypothetical protein WUBG_13490 [Wuchereria bancrofti]|uniref:Uncharacterized protein n=1 Tax=Wuchereria bancrofti TaxID=6293 RepID=J9E0G8_WUCBA|nr:hypothetical protein WUBG_13490 [Wuchereria bancrofti]
MKESKKDMKSKNILKHDKASDEALTQNVSLSQTLGAEQVKVQQPSEGENQEVMDKVLLFLQSMIVNKLSITIEYKFRIKQKQKKKK